MCGVRAAFRRCTCRCAPKQSLFALSAHLLALSPGERGREALRRLACACGPAHSATSLAVAMVTACLNAREPPGHTGHTSLRCQLDQRAQAVLALGVGLQQRLVPCRRLPRAHQALERRKRSGARAPSSCRGARAARAWTAVPARRRQAAAVSAHRRSSGWNSAAAS